MMTIYDQGECLLVGPVGELPVTLGGAARHNVQNALFAAAIAYAGGASLAQVRRGLGSFDPSWERAPGRLNVYRGHPFQVVLDYGHNPDGFRCMGELARRMDVPGRRICVVGYPGNRRDEDIYEAARALVPHFDLFVCRGEDDPRGRPYDQVPRMFERAFRAEGIGPERIHVVLDEAESVEYALRLATPGDLVVMFAADLERTWRQIREFRALTPQQSARASHPG